MSRTILIVPHGTGIGDFVNLRPLASAVVQHYPGRRVKVLGPASLAWLLPEGAEIATRILGIPPWKRMRPDSAGARLLRAASVEKLGSAGRVLPTVTTARILSVLAVARGFEPINLFESFARLDLDRRWTPGPWSCERRHVIDLLANDLERRGIPVGPDQRRPVVEVPPIPLSVCPAVLLSPGAGSTLKEAPDVFWSELARRLVSRGITPIILLAPWQSTMPVQGVAGTITIADPELRVVAGMLSSADVVVSPDSGILHLAAALGTQYVGVFGSSDPLFLGPYSGTNGENVESRSPHAPACRRCWTAQMLPAARCALYAPTNCLAGLETAEVEDAVVRLLDAYLSPSANAAVTHDGDPFANHGGPDPGGRAGYPDVVRGAPPSP